MGFIIKKATPQIGNGVITASILLRDDDLQAPGSIFNIPEYPAVAGYFWNCIFMNGEIIEDLGNVPYTGLTNIHIQASGAPNYQLRFGGGFMSQPVGTWHTTVVTTILPTVYAVNDRLQIHNNSTLTAGSTSLTIYMGAILQKY
jgi:hypothetical protein